MNVEVMEDASLTFVLRGDSSPKTVEFFMTGPTGLVVTVVGSKVNTTGTGTNVLSGVYALDAYDERQIRLKVSAIEKGSYTVTWGYKIAPSTSGGVGFEQVTQDTFELRACVGETSCPVKNGTAVTNTSTQTTSNTTTTPAETTTTSVRRSGGGGGGGGGGAAALPTSGSGDSGSGSDDVVPIQDVTSQGSALTEGVVDVSEPAPVTAPFRTQSTNVVQKIGEEGGKWVLATTIMLFAISAFFGVLSVRKMKEADKS